MLIIVLFGAAVWCGVDIFCIFDDNFYTVVIGNCDITALLP
jgi:hypothetical protein